MNDRVLLAAVHPNNLSLFPSPLLSRIWEKRLLPAKLYLAKHCGIRLFGLRLVPFVGSPNHRDFEKYATDRGFSIPCSDKFRFILSDGAWDRLPPLSSTSPLLIAIQLQSTSQAPVAHPLDEAHLLAYSSNRKLVDDISDFLLDFSFCSGFLPSRILACFFSKNTMRDLFKRKVEFAYKRGLLDGSDVPYVSFSSLARQSRSFGSALHLSQFCALWDAFLLEIVDEISFTRSDLLKALASYPTYRNQISPARLKQVIDKTPSGINQLIVQRKSLSARTNPRYRNRILPIFSSLNIKGTGRKRFGVRVGGSIDVAIRDAVESEALYLSRIYVGTK